MIVAAPDEGSNMQRAIGIAAVTASLILGCGGSNNDSPNKTHGTSTKRASIQPPKPVMPPASPTPPAAPTPAAAVAVAEDAPPAQLASTPIAQFGEPLKLTAEDNITIAAVISAPEQFNGKYVRLSGTVKDVCPHVGCWFEVADDSSTERIFVKFEDPQSGHLVPKEAIGKFVVVEGTFKMREISPELAKHFKEEAGASKEELAKITGPQKQLMLADPRAQISGVSN
jgi:hypothetical protein